MSEENKSTNLSKIEREELIAICERLRGDSSDPSTEADINRLITFIRSRKYGLMFEKHEEEVDRLLKDHLPAFYDVEDKTIKTKDTEDCNFLLEGDNLHSLKLLEKTHKGKIDVIYIDPPYNTGNNDFIYADNMVGQDDGFRHSKWLSFMKERLEIARDLLSNEGVIFISIDYREVSNLKLLCDAIFSELNFLSILTWDKGYTKSLSAFFGVTTEYIIVYAKNKEFLSNNGIVFRVKKKGLSELYSILKNAKENGTSIDEVKKEIKDYYKDNEVIPKGLKTYTQVDSNYRLYRTDAFTNRQPSSSKQIYTIENPFTKEPYPVPKNGWRIKEETFKEYLNKDRILFTKDSVQIKFYIDETEDNCPSSLILDNSIGGNDIKEVLGGNVFSYPKPVSLLKYIISIHPNPSATILDFFAGSGTTGQAVLELNQEDGGDRHFILCTNNENNICEDVTYQRLKTVITGIRPDGTKYSDGIKANLKYFKTEMVAFNDEELEDKLITSSECLMQLENLSLLSSPDIDIAYCDEDLPDIFANKPHLKTLYLLEDVLFNAEQAKYIESHSIEIKRIADCYYEGV